MASGLKSRILYKEHTQDNLWTGTYKMLIRPKSIPSPVGEDSFIDVSTLEDLQEVQERGRRAAASLSVQGAMDKEALDAINALGQDTPIDILILYGNSGLGEIAKYVFVGTASAKPDDATEEHLTMTVSIPVQTVPKPVTDTLSVTMSGEGLAATFTVAAA